MNVTISIDGREALPVRAIPFVMGWRLSPDELAKDFAKHGLRGESSELRAFQFDPDNQHPAITPGEWDQVIVRLEALDLRLRRANGGDRDEISYAAWRDQSPASRKAVSSGRTSSRPQA